MAICHSLLDALNSLYKFIVMKFIEKINSFSIVKINHQHCSVRVQTLSIRIQITKQEAKK